MTNFGIDSATLIHIYNYLAAIDYEPTPISSMAEYNLSIEKDFITKIDLESLHLLTIAAHKLSLQGLQILASARIAEVFKNSLEDPKSNGFNLEIHNKHVDICLNYPVKSFQKFMWNK